MFIFRFFFALIGFILRFTLGFWYNLLFRKNKY